MSLITILKKRLPESLFVQLIYWNRRLRGPGRTFNRQAWNIYKHLNFPAGVQAGPFAGMKYINQATGSVLVPKLVGTYEKELHDCLNEIIHDDPDLIVDVGSAEGYYAIGMALRLPRAKVVAFDTDRYARHLLNSLAQQNAVENRLSIQEACDPERLQETLIKAIRPVVICDCEGYEDQLLDPAKVPALSRTVLLVELHELMAPSVTAHLTGRFRSTHNEQLLSARERVAEDWPLQTCIDDHDAKAMLSERRLPDMQWLYLRPKAQ